MKKFIAKYLPTEDQIKKEDFFFVTTPSTFEGFSWDPGRLTQCEKITKDCIINYNGECFEKDNVKKAEIFLCDKKDITKPIGRISMDAMNYIEDGSEIGKNEVQEWWGMVLSPHHAMVMKIPEGEWDKKLLREGPTVFKIKGPCGHFH